MIRSKPQLHLFSLCDSADSPCPQGNNQHSQSTGGAFLWPAGVCVAFPAAALPPEPLVPALWQLEAAGSAEGLGQLQGSAWRWCSACAGPGSGAVPEPGPAREHTQLVLAARGTHSSCPERLTECQDLLEALQGGQVHCYFPLPQTDRARSCSSSAQDWLHHQWYWCPLPLPRLQISVLLQVMLTPLKVLWVYFLLLSVSQLWRSNPGGGSDQHCQ